MPDDIDPIRDAFEKVRRAGDPSPLESWLPADTMRESLVLIELVQIELQMRLAAGVPARVEEYLARFPQLGTDPAKVLRMVATEFQQRRRSEPELGPDEYRGRFPQLRNHPRWAGLFGGSDSFPSLASTVGQGNGTSWLTGRGLLPIAGYEVLEEVGRGGMGVVYKARQEGTRRLVALKMIRPGLAAGPEETKRFRAEAAAAARFQHPNIVQIYEVGDSQGQLFLALEFVEGGTLAQRLAGQPQPGRPAAALMEILARAVQVAHEQGIVHRDLKPANVLLQRPDPTVPLGATSPKIADFGLAKDLDQCSTQTQSGTVLGTPSYMAPEQASGKTREIGPPADVYALGAILYEMLTGRPPFRGETALDTLQQVTSIEPIPPSRLQPRVPRDLQTICLKCLHKDPARRYTTAAALAEDLRRFQAGEPIQARPVGRLERALKWTRRYPLVTALMVFVVLGAGIATFFAVRASRTALAEAKARQRAERLLYCSTIQLAHQEWRNGQVEAALAKLEECPRELRGWEHDYLSRLCQGTGRTFHRHARQVKSVAFSPDGARIVSCDAVDITHPDEPGEIKVWDVNTGRQILSLQGHTQGINCVVFSPDGQRLASGSYDGTVKVWDASTGQEVRTLGGHGYGVTCVVFSPDGQRLASSSHDGTVKVWDADRGTELFALQSPRRVPVNSVAFSPDGKRIASGEGVFGQQGGLRVWNTDTGGQLLHLEGETVWSVAFSPDGKQIVTGHTSEAVGKVRNAATGQELVALRGHQAYLTGLTFSPDGKRLVSSCADKTVKVWDPQSGRELRTFCGHLDVVTSVAFHPEGRRVASSSADGTVKVWDLDDTGWEARSLTGHARAIRSVAISADGNRIVSGGGDLSELPPKRGELLVWDVQANRRIHTLEGHAKPIRGVAISADGRRIASGSEDRMVKVWDADRGQELLTLKGHADIVRGVAFRPDGQQIASASHDKTVKLWDAETGQEIRTLEGHAGWVTSVTFSPDGTRLVSGSDDRTVKVWDAATGRVLVTLEGHADNVLSVSFSPYGERIASCGDDKTLKVWDSHTGREILSCKAQARALSVTFSPNGQRLVSAHNGATVRIWDAVTGQEALRLRGHGILVSSVVLSRDGNRIVGGDFEGTVTVWEAERAIASGRSKP